MYILYIEREREREIDPPILRAALVSALEAEELRAAGVLTEAEADLAPRD